MRRGRTGAQDKQLRIEGTSPTTRESTRATLLVTTSSRHLGQTTRKGRIATGEGARRQSDPKTQNNLRRDSRNSNLWSKVRRKASGMR
ncbi:hypothetical protein C922_05688 [Plasmodium inui San Antonio 1]|uniref:Uncharacterized protein n=1 Tax=Plasmodium inui San Antonio 1 TaxID=1237626 RepID=W6ZSP1_9APIC|nr:hypothetical protein C922_05688 [Plasmodium inui San Antonio 1]EUD63932.1 hypothetical protein C922_05688 [Plasmodium inui San Antonio 1]